MKEELLELLRNSNEHLSSDFLCGKLNVRGHILRVAVNSLRCNGYPVCSDRTGYWLGDNQDVLHTIMQLKGRATQMNEAADGMLQSLIVRH